MLLKKNLRRWSLQNQKREIHLDSSQVMIHRSLQLNRVREGRSSPHLLQRGKNWTEQRWFQSKGCLVIADKPQGQYQREGVSIARIGNQRVSESQIPQSWHSRQILLTRIRWRLKSMSHWICQILQLRISRHRWIGSNWLLGLEERGMSFVKPLAILLRSVDEVHEGYD